MNSEVGRIPFSIPGYLFAIRHRMAEDSEILQRLMEDGAGVKTVVERKKIIETSQTQRRMERLLAGAEKRVCSICCLILITGKKMLTLFLLKALYPF